MTQPLKSSQSKTKQEPIVQSDIVQNKSENGIKCIQCQKVLSQDEFRDHIKLHVKAGTMAKKTVDLVKNSKTIVKLETMNIPIKRKRHGSDGSSAKRIKIQAELSSGFYETFLKMTNIRIYYTGGGGFFGYLSG